MESKFKKYKLNDDITMQVISYTEQMMTAKFWFTGKGFPSTHHHSNEESNVIVEGRFEATDGDRTFLVEAGDVVHVSPDVEHNLACLTPTGAFVSTWTPARKDFAKYAELA